MSQHLRSTLIAIAETEQQEFSLKQQLRHAEQEIADVNELVAPVAMVFQKPSGRENNVSQPTAANGK